MFKNKSLIYVRAKNDVKSQIDKNHFKMIGLKMME